MISPPTSLPIAENAHEELVIRQWTSDTIPSFRAYSQWYMALIDTLDCEDRSELKDNVVDMWLKTCCRHKRVSDARNESAESNCAVVGESTAT